MMYTYKEVISYLERFITPVSQVTNPELFLERMKVFLKLLHNPQEKFKSIVISGTSGKGSTSFLISSLLTSAGYKTGYTQSPHLQKVTERLQINTIPIQDGEFVLLFNEIMPIIAAMQTTQYGAPSYYEILLALAFLYFAREQVDIAIVEVGLEGKYDGTNVLSPLAFVLTNISLDHTQILGNTIAAIADEATYKMLSLHVADISQKPLIITGVVQPSVVQLVHTRAKQSQAEVMQLHRDFSYDTISSDSRGSIFNFITPARQITAISLSLLGEFQIENASLALATVFSLSSFGVRITEQVIRQTLSSVHFAGRFEVLLVEDKHIILDGAHNPAKMEAFLTSLQKYYPEQKKIFIVGFKKDKEVAEMLSKIARIAKNIILTEFHSNIDVGKNLSMDINTLRLLSQTAGDPSNMIFEQDGKNALTHAKQLAIGDNDLIVVTGSLYLVGELRELLSPLLS